MGKYDKKGSYASYKKNNKERQKEDYYATPIVEVTNILEIEGIKDGTILEPCVGGGHMLQGIIDYAEDKDIFVDITIRDFIDRKPFYIQDKNSTDIVETTFGQDFLADDYPTDKFDYVIMNPPFMTIEPFTLRALELTKRKLIMFARTKFIEGQSRYEKIFSQYPPQRMYQYIERVACAKDGDFDKYNAAVEANAWFVWDLDDPAFGTNEPTKIYWIHRK